MANHELAVSVVFPCLNEAETLAPCIQSALAGIAAAGVTGEVVVADNGSSDGSQALAEAAGARVVDAKHPGYGSALRAGMKAARGKYLIFLDADLSYDGADIPAFLDALAGGAELVIGSRLKGTIDPGAMPPSHRYVGTPVMTLLANILFGCGISDINCGMRALTRETFDRLDLHADGMEFASEMMVKAAREGVRVAEVPIHFHRDQRSRQPHLRSFRDGWRHLQLMMHYCSFAVYLVPGLALSAGGVLCQLFGSGPLGTLPVQLLAMVAVVLGTLVLLLGLIAQGRAPGAASKPYGETLAVRFMRRWVNVEHGVVLGLLVGAAGFALMVAGALQLPREVTLEFLQFTPARVALIGATLLLSGIITLFSSLFMGLFGIRVEGESLPEKRE